MRTQVWQGVNSRRLIGTGSRISSPVTRARACGADGLQSVAIRGCAGNCDAASESALGLTPRGSASNAGHALSTAFVVF